MPLLNVPWTQTRRTYCMEKRVCDAIDFRPRREGKVNEIFRLWQSARKDYLTRPLPCSVQQPRTSGSAEERREKKALSMLISRLSLNAASFFRLLGRGRGLEPQTQYIFRCSCFSSRVSSLFLDPFLSGHSILKVLDFNCQRGHKVFLQVQGPQAHKVERHKQFLPSGWCFGKTFGPLSPIGNTWKHAADRKGCFCISQCTLRSQVHLNPDIFPRPLATRAAKNIFVSESDADWSAYKSRDVGREYFPF